MVQADWYDKIEMMGGTAQKNFDVSVTHLIASEVGTKKYIVCSSMNHTMSHTLVFFVTSLF